MEILSFNIENKFKISIKLGFLLCSFIFYGSAVYLVEGIDYNSELLRLLTIYLLVILYAVAFLFFFSKKSLYVKIPTFILNLLIIFYAISPFIFLCFDACPSNSRLINYFSFYVNVDVHRITHLGNVSKQGG